MKCIISSSKKLHENIESDYNMLIKLSHFILLASVMPAVKSLTAVRVSYGNHHLKRNNCIVKVLLL